MPTHPKELQAGTAVLRCADCRGKVVDETTRTISDKTTSTAQRTLAPAPPSASTSMPPPGRGPTAGPSITTTAGPSGTTYHAHASPATIDSIRPEAKRRRTERYNKRAGVVDPSEMNQDEPVQNEPEWFRCISCGVPRANDYKDIEYDACQYCTNGYEEDEPGMFEKWCIQGAHVNLAFFFNFPDRTHRDDCCVDCAGVYGLPEAPSAGSDFNPQTPATSAYNFSTPGMSTPGIGGTQVSTSIG